jgi:hypothetical protein
MDNPEFDTLATAAFKASAWPRAVWRCAQLSEAQALLQVLTLAAGALGLARLAEREQLRQRDEERRLASRRRPRTSWHCARPACSHWQPRGVDGLTVRHIRIRARSALAPCYAGRMASGWKSAAARAMAAAAMRNIWR